MPYTGTDVPSGMTSMTLPSRLDASRRLSGAVVAIVVTSSAAVFSSANAVVASPAVSNTAAPKLAIAALQNLALSMKRPFSSQTDALMLASRNGPKGRVAVIQRGVEGRPYRNR